MHSALVLADHAQMRAEVELIACFSFKRADSEHTYYRGKPEIITDAAEIDYCQGNTRFRVKMLGPEEISTDGARASTSPKDEVPTGDEIRDAREAAGMTQKALANRMRVSQRLICAWELGEKPLPVARLVRLHAVLGEHLDR